MARLSSIDRLPAEVREKIGELRRNGSTIDQIMAKLAELDAADEISRSALGRHVKRLDKLGESLRRSRAMAEGLARSLDDEKGDSVTRLSIELLQNSLFDLLQDARAGDDDDDGKNARAMVRDPKAARALAETLQRIVRTKQHSLEFLEKIEARGAARAKTEAAAAVDLVGKQRGLTAETLNAIKAGIFGVQA